MRKRADDEHGSESERTEDEDEREVGERLEKENERVCESERVEEEDEYVRERESKRKMRV